MPTLKQKKPVAPTPAPLFRQREAAMAVLAGALYALGFCGFDQGYLAWVAFVPLFWVCEHPGRWQRTAALAWICGVVAHLGCYTWIIHVLRVFAFLPSGVAVLGYVLLCVAQSSQFALWGGLMHALRHRSGVALWLAAPAAWVVAEWLVPALFPSYLANSQYLVPWVVQSADLVGPLGLSFLVCSGSVAAYQALTWVLRRRVPRSALGLASFVLLFAGNALYGYAKLADWRDTMAHPDGGLRVGVVQANIGIYDKAGKPAEGLHRHRAQSLELQAQGAQLIVWPESAFFYGINDNITNVKSQVFGALRTPLLFGGVRLERPAGNAAQPLRQYNTAFLTDGTGNILGSYDKTYLLAFGETLPLGEWLPWLYRLSPQTSHFYAGTRPNTLTLGALKLGVVICYEDILPSFVRRTMQAAPDVLINMTNDAWFGRSQEPRIHLALATLRAIESRRYLVRAVNTGISAVIDPTGVIIEEAPPFTRANLLATVLPLKKQTWYTRLGDVVGYLCVAFVAALLTHQRFRSQRRRTPP